MSRWFPETVWLTVGGKAAAAEASLSGLEQELDRRGLRAGTRVACVLAGGLVRYRVVPWNAEFAASTARAAFARHCFEETYGEAAQAWTIVLSQPRHGAAALACAVDTAALARIDGIAKARRLRIASVQPSLMHAFNRHRRRIGRTDAFWFVLAEPDSTTALWMAAGVARHVKVVAAPLPDLDRMLEREWLSLGMDAPLCPVFVAGDAASGAWRTA